MPAPKGNKNALGNDGGRPKIGLDVLWDNWQIDILEMYKEGSSDVEIRALIVNKVEGEMKASYTLWDRWLEEEVEFSEIIKRGRLLSEAWWQNQGRTNLKESKFNPTLWYMNMKNRFGWRDKQEITGKDGTPVMNTNNAQEMTDAELLAIIGDRDK